MTLVEFNGLAEDEQALLTWKAGTYLAQNFDGVFNILLFQVEGFYVEVFYHSQLDFIYSYNSFTSTDYLEPYLSKINIDGL
jgi:hypothetical protein